MVDDVVHNRAIEMVPLKKSHTAAYIVEELKECLKLYHIEIDQIIAMVSDNASNMLEGVCNERLKRLNNLLNQKCIKFSSENK